MARDKVSVRELYTYTRTERAARSIARCWRVSEWIAWREKVGLSDDDGWLAGWSVVGRELGWLLLLLLLLLPLLIATSELALLALWVSGGGHTKCWRIIIICQVETSPLQISIRYPCKSRAVLLACSSTLPHHHRLTSLHSISASPASP